MPNTRKIKNDPPAKAGKSVKCKSDLDVVMAVHSNQSKQKKYKAKSAKETNSKSKNATKVTKQTEKAVVHFQEDDQYVEMEAEGEN